MAKRKQTQQDATIRNVRASNRRDGKLAARVKSLEMALAALNAEVDRVKHAIRSAGSSL
jgi:hypothetical protein